MPLFQPSLVAPRDPAGFGLWRIGHYLEHRQFIPLAAAAAPSVTIPDFDIAAWDDDPARVRIWLDAHRQMHVLLDQVTGQTNIDFSAVDFGNDEEFQTWQDDHATAHQGYRNFFGLT